MRCQYTRDVDAGPQCPPELITEKHGRKIIAAGTIIDQQKYPITRPDHDVRAGIAIPLDDECRKACGMSTEQIAAAQKALAKMYEPTKELLNGEEHDDE